MQIKHEQKRISLHRLVHRLVHRTVQQDVISRAMHLSTSALQGQLGELTSELRQNKASPLCSKPHQSAHQIRIYMLYTVYTRLLPYHSGSGLLLVTKLHPGCALDHNR